ncbi:MAG: hypothetical protein U0136_18490 [Bdellovibrionota bacterium]
MRQRLRDICNLLAVLCLSLAIICFARWAGDIRQIQRQVGNEIEGATSQKQLLDQSVTFLKQHVREDSNNSYFLVPLFEFMRPTALQVIDRGGDCAYLGRALIVILRQYGVSASKLAVYHNGAAIHSVVQVNTDSGDYVVDPLFHIIHQNPDGSPIPLDKLRDPAVLRQSLEWAHERGDLTNVDSYPDDYYFTDVRTIDWTRSALLRVSYSLLRTVLPTPVVDTLPRPYFVEEPALLLAMFSIALAMFCMFVRDAVQPPADARESNENDSFGHTPNISVARAKL